MLPGMVPVMMMGEPREQRSAGQLEAGISFGAADVDTVQANAVDFGAESPSRRIVVVLTEDGAGTDVSSATIGGVSATIHARGHFGGSTGLHVVVFSAVVPTGTSGDVVVNYASGLGGSVWRGNTFRLVRPNALDAGTDQTSVTAGDVSVTVSTAADGVIIAGYVGSTNTVGTGVTWTNATEVYDVGTTVRHSAAWDSVTGAGTQQVTATQGTISNSGNDLAVVSFEPF